MREERFLAMDIGHLSSLGVHDTFETASEHAQHGAQRNSTPYVVVRVVGEVRLVTQAQVVRFDQEAEDAHA